MYFSHPTLLVALLAVVQECRGLPGTASRLAARKDMSLLDQRPNLPFDQNTISTCTWWWDNDGSIPCQAMPGEWGISLENFLRWNPSITADCGDYITGRSYCVEAPASDPGPSPTTTTGGPTPTTPPGNGVETPLPTQPGMVTNCNKFHLVARDEFCDDIVARYGIALQQFLAWNPRAGSDCKGLWGLAYACVGTIGSTPPPTTTTTPPGNGVATPTPTQPGMVADCNKFHFVVPDEPCGRIADSYGISLQQFLSWNPRGSSNCEGIWGSTYACVGVIGFTPSPPPPPTPTAPGNGIATPLPTQPGMVSNCNKFHFVGTGEFCDPIALAYGITLQQFLTWNPRAGSRCQDLWGSAYACVGVIGQ